jgi:hypothetical protein
MNKVQANSSKTRKKELIEINLPEFLTNNIIPVLFGSR